MPIPSLKGKLYYISFINDFTRKVWVAFLHKKDEAFYIFKESKALTKKESGYQLKYLQTYNSGEYTSHEFESNPKRA